MGTTGIELEQAGKGAFDNEKGARERESDRESEKEGKTE